MLRQNMKRSRRQFLQAVSAGTALSLCGVTSAVAQDSAGPSREESAQILEEMDGSGAPASPYIVTDVRELQAMEADLSGYFRIDNDIDASVTADWNSGKGFRPIGAVQDGEPEEASINLRGNGYTIDGLTIERLNRDDVGLFSNLTGEVTNLSLTNARVISDIIGYEAGRYRIGVLAGRAENATITDCHVTGEIKGAQGVGGLVGSVDDSVVRHSSASTNIKGWSKVAGFAGETISGSTVTRCESDGVIETVTADGKVIDIPVTVGGFVGLNDSSTIKQSRSSTTVDNPKGSLSGAFLGINTKGEISQCISTGSYQGGYSSGGLVGFNRPDAVVRNSYTMSEVTVNNEDGYAGSLIGSNWGIVENSYAAGTIELTTEQQTAAGLFGRLGSEELAQNTEVVVRNTYRDMSKGVAEDVIWDFKRGSGTITIEQDREPINSVEAEERFALTTEEMTGEAARENLVGFDFESVWEVNPESDGYPLLAWQTPTFVVESIRIGSPVISDELEVNTRITNTGERAGNQTVSLSVGDLGTGEVDLEIAGGETVSHTFTIPTEPGDGGFVTATVETSDDTTSEDVQLRDPAVFSLTSVDTNSPQAGEPLEVSVSLQNTGDRPGEKPIRLDAGTLGSTEQTLDVDEGELASTTLTLQTEAGDAGEYDLTVETNADSMTETVTVAAAPESDDSEESTPTATPTATPEPTDTAGSEGDDTSGETGDEPASSTDGVGPGFGVGSSLASLGGLAYLVKRRLAPEDKQD
jgi:hypothetical protein